MSKKKTAKKEKKEEESLETVVAQRMESVQNSIRKIGKRARLLTAQGKLRWEVEDHDEDGRPTQLFTVVDRDIRLTLRREDDGETHFLIVSDNAGNITPERVEYGNGNPLAKFFDELVCLLEVNKLVDSKAEERLARAASALDALVEVEEADGESAGTDDAEGTGGAGEAAPEATEETEEG